MWLLYPCSYHQFQCGIVPISREQCVCDAMVTYTSEIGDNRLRGLRLLGISMLHRLQVSFFLFLHPLSVHYRWTQICSLGDSSASVPRAIMPIQHRYRVLNNIIEETCDRSPPGRVPSTISSCIPRCLAKFHLAWLICRRRWKSQVQISLHTDGTAFFWFGLVC